MRKEMIMVICLLVVLGCSSQIKNYNIGKNLNKSDLPEDIDFDPYYCEKDEDCIVTYYDINKCCEAGCDVFAFNLEGINKNKAWREANCNFQNETEFNSDKWIYCPDSPFYEFPECDVTKLKKTIAKCIHNKCVTYINESK